MMISAYIFNKCMPVAFIITFELFCTDIIPHVMSDFNIFLHGKLYIDIDNLI